MRMLMYVEFPIEPFNTVLRKGSFPAKMKQIMDEVKPEAAYFGEYDGKRGGVLVVNVDSPSEIPRLAEPWFFTFNAEVRFRVAMTIEDMARADVEGQAKKWF